MTADLATGNGKDKCISYALLLTDFFHLEVESDDPTFTLQFMLPRNTTYEEIPGRRDGLPNIFSWPCVVSVQCL